jgi:hypothetical protein
MDDGGATSLLRQLYQDVPRPGTPPGEKPEAGRRLSTDSRPDLTLSPVLATLSAVESVLQGKLRALAERMNKQHIIEEIGRTADANGGVPLGKQRFLAETGIRESDWSGRFWTKWSDAVREAGYEPNAKQTAFDNDWLLKKLASLVRELGHYPVAAELRMKARADPEFPSRNTFTRFGRKAQVASALVTWCESSPGWADVHAICAPLAVREEADEALVEHNAPAPVGYVYLLKSGKYYKIGRSNAPGRREYELSIQLPEPVVTVHTITTDDPVGIERYWHQRFAERRKKGEWFQLRSEDVSAFRRRKFM